MPSKDPAVIRASYLAKQLKKFRTMGLEPVDVRDSHSPLRCDECGKETGRSSAHIFRHHNYCSKFIGSPDHWGPRRRFSGNCNRSHRKHIFGENGFCINEGCDGHKDDAINSRRRNLIIANRRKREAASN